MSASETVKALERNLITEDEALEQAMVDDLNDLYRKAVLELAPHLAAEATELRSRLY
ncbi:hypothetical protein GCM10011390_04740 [Aureimonas endophytica]|uniref:Uncharacterized protein n=1 Tax=Aureimonas endophytica TaxID=2027858 RepID=A0A916ZDQ0_9HYPH|nr:hypothetical protein [Aureimonas endophytica]GGD89037.1 hypothetical protein GCM10011390_04740 [Aureimonas endophytica]